MSCNEHYTFWQQLFDRRTEILISDFCAKLRFFFHISLFLIFNLYLGVVENLVEFDLKLHFIIVVTF